MERKKARKRRRGRSAAEEITRKGLRIFNKRDQIKSLGGYRWDVASESKEGVWYRVSYATKSPTCECEYHTTGGQCRCKRMAIVERLLLVAAESEYDPKEIVIERQDLKCPKCPSKEHTRDGWYYGEHQKKRRYRCSKCGRRFRDNLGFEYRHTPPVYITLALMLCGMQAVCGQHTDDFGASGSQRTPECHNRAGGALRQTGRMVRQDFEAAAHKRQVGMR